MPLYLVPVKLGSSRFEGSVHRHDQMLLPQLEEYEPVADRRSLDVFSAGASLVTDLQRTSSLAEFYECAAQGGSGIIAVPSLWRK